MSRSIAITILVLISLALVGCSSQTTDAGTSITPSDYIEQYVDTATTHLLVDVRAPEAYVGGFIAGAVNIPQAELESRLSEIPRDIPVVVYCSRSSCATEAAALLVANGYTNVYDLGGTDRWEAGGNPLVQAE
jgi:rhodanese-related sulfurtransferase